MISLPSLLSTLLSCETLHVAVTMSYLDIHLERRGFIVVESMGNRPYMARK